MVTPDQQSHDRNRNLLAWQTATTLAGGLPAEHGMEARDQRTPGGMRQILPRRRLRTFQCCERPATVMTVRAKLRLVAGASLATVTSLIVSPLAIQPAQAAAIGFRIENGRLVEAHGVPFTMRGTNQLHAFHYSQTGESIAEIESLGANTVRVMVSGGRATQNNGLLSDVQDVANIVGLCKANKIICILADFDTTGTLAQFDWTLDRAADYWISVQDALKGQESHVLINIGNEPYGDANQNEWTAATIAAITKLRNAGFAHTLVVDAPDWGQDRQFVMRDNADAVYSSDPDRNTLFSIHMYSAFDTATAVIDYMDSFQRRGLPLVIGEFSNDFGPRRADTNTIMAQAVSRGIGYLGWSWSGNTGDSLDLNQVASFDVARLTDWGQRLFNGADGIRATSTQATIYGGA